MDGLYQTIQTGLAQGATKHHVQLFATLPEKIRQFYY